MIALVDAERPMTIRQLFYRLVTRGVIGKTEGEYKSTVCRLALRLREQGAIDWNDIVDNTRLMRKPASWSSVHDVLFYTAQHYRRAIWDQAEDYVEVWSEKDAISGVLYSVTAPWDVPLMIARGFASASFLHSAAQTIEAQGKPAFLYYFGDHDPSGVDIDRAIEKRLREFAPDAEIYFERVAVLPWQIDEWELPTRPTKKTDSRAKNFAGESVEVDAIPPAELRFLAQGVIGLHVDEELLTSIKAAEQSEREIFAAMAQRLGSWGAAMNPVEKVVNALQDRGLKVTKSAGQWMAQCPSHEDRKPSLAIGEGDDLRALLNCHAGCANESVTAALGLTMADLYPERQEQPRRIVTTYDYTDEAGEILFQTVRYDPKDFRQRRPDGNGGWVWNLIGTRRVLYRLPELLAATGTVYDVEGEKDADRLIALGLTATCNPMGAGKWREEYVDYLRGVDKVIVVADRDAAGRAHAAAVADSLTRAGITVELVEPATGKDVSDHLAAGHSIEELVAINLNGDEVDRQGLPETVDLEALMSGERPTREFCIEPLSPAGKLVGFVAKRENLKSLFNLYLAGCKAIGQAVLHQPAGEPTHVLYLDQEMGEDDLYDRLSDFGWTPDHPDWQTLKQHLHYYQLIDLPPLDTVEGGEMLERMVQADQAQLVVIDTLSRVTSGGENDNDTYTALYRNTEIRLKRRGVTVHRLDHLGKDAAKGSRGGSAKEDILDVIWQMEKSSIEGTVVLTKTKGRQDGYPARLTVHLETLNGVASFTTSDKTPDWLPKVVAQVDARTSRRCRGANRPESSKGGRDRETPGRSSTRRQVPKSPEHTPGTPWEHPLGTLAGTPWNTHPRNPYKR